MVTPYANVSAGTAGTGDIMPVTNELECVHAQLQKIIKTRGHFPNDQALTTNPSAVQ